MELTADERAILGGRDGAGRAFAMDMVVAYGRAVGAGRLVPIRSAHVDGCLHHGQVSLDFVQHLIGLGAKVNVPTSLNVGSVDLIHPALFIGSAEKKTDGQALMEAHLKLGCRPSFTCAPYQLQDNRPGFGDHIAWGESNAIVFANSVIGARTERYGDFIDLACGIAGCAPAYGLHLDENRRAQVLLTVDAQDLEPHMAAVAIGHFAGRQYGDTICAIDGLSAQTSEDDLKALGAVAASTGAVGLFHAVGLTPEAMTRGEAFAGRNPVGIDRLTADMLRDEITRLSTIHPGARLSAISLGTPHFSVTEFERLMPLLVGARSAIRFLVNTDRATLSALETRGWLGALADFGAEIVVDTCVYVTTILEDLSGAVMTNSGKMAHYAPANLGCEIAFGSLADCVASARAGRLVRA